MTRTVGDYYLQIYRKAGQTPSHVAADPAVKLAWEDAGTDEPGDQNADSALAEHGYWSLGPNSDGTWTVELIVRDENLDEIPGGVSLGHFPTYTDAVAAAQRYEDESQSDG